MKTNDVLVCNNDRAKWFERCDERVRKWWERRMQVGGIDLYQQTEEEREGRERRQSGSPEPAGTRHKRSSSCVHGRPEDGGGGGKKGKKGSSRAVAGQVGAQGQLTSSTRLTEGTGEGARGAIRYDGLDTIPTREEGALGLLLLTQQHTPPLGCPPAWLDKVCRYLADTKGRHR